MSGSPRQLNQYHVFVASPGDVNVERQHVRQFFDRYNRHTGHLWNVRFEVVDWENYSTIGVGRPQELITEQTLEKYRESLVLVIGIMGQRFGSPTGKAESGTEEEFNWAMESLEKHGFPEIKWFFRKTDKLEMPTDPEEALKAVEQWTKALTFRRRMEELGDPVFYTEYSGPTGFRDVFENDLNRWLGDSSRPWVSERAATTTAPRTTLSPPGRYYENIEEEFGRQDIAGIDNDRAFEIPLSEIYVRLRGMFDEIAPEETEAHESGPIDIQTALLRYPKLVIVGDPGSGKSTFLKYIALMLARSFRTGNSSIALDKLCLPEPLPVPIFLSCWDLADFLKQRQQVRLTTLVKFVADRLGAYDFSVSTDDVERLLESGNCCLLFDGLDEVPTDAGRTAVSRLLEECVGRYGDNRFVVTSRIRGYTGGAMLTGEFTRCDIQPFDAADRQEFIRNWVTLLFRVPPEDLETKGSRSSQEFTGLTRAIESSDRIRALAVNPLLLTVIAIVHWNRKRLPEQRVELYEECVDVLLGQRKEAEHIQVSRKVGAMDERRIDHTHEERAWVRKRFAEIALHILSQDTDRDEATKADVIRLLTPRFIDKGAASEEQAATRAELFLQRQELRSGLLVSRRVQSYRFVSLAFQEYLAAWELSNMDFNRVAVTIRSRLRLPKWFETLRLLGSQWAKESDDKVDRYIAWMLANRGTSIDDQAPVVALCANVVQDISGVAELKTQTRATFREAVEATLATFRRGSGVPAKTQLEILEALGQLGAPVKSHLADATKASLLQVRLRAIDLLLLHLSDDELFALEHIWEDRSKEPIRVYVLALMDRDRKRALGVVAQFRSMSPERSQGIWEALSEIGGLEDTDSRAVLQNFATHASHHRIDALETLAEKWPDETTRELLAERAVQDGSEYVRRAALEALAQKWPDQTTGKLLAERAVQDENEYTRRAAVEGLEALGADVRLRELLIDRAASDENPDARRDALDRLTSLWPDESTRDLLSERLALDKSGLVRKAIVKALTQSWQTSEIRAVIMLRASADADASVREAILNLLVNTWPDNDTTALCRDLSLHHKTSATRLAAARALASGWWEQAEIRQFVRRIVENDPTEDLRAELRYHVCTLKPRLAGLWESYLRGSKEREAVPRTASGFPALRVRQFRLRNIGVFKETGKVPVQSATTVLLGDNATGKTTILKCLGLAAIGSDAANEVEDDASSYLRKGSDKPGAIEVLFDLVPDPGAYPDEYAQFAVGLHIEAGSDRFTPLPDEEISLTTPRVNCIKRLNALRKESDFAFGLVCAYGATRTFSASRFGVDPELTRDENEWVIPLFRWDARVTHPGLLSRLVRGDLRNIKDAPDTLGLKLQEVIATSLRRLLPRIEGLHSTGADDLRLNGTDLKFSELSDGYRSLLTILGHFVRSASRLLEWQADPTQVHGIAIIDEVDLHLHPSWQQHILNDLRDTFPNVQFIVATHSPLVASATADATIFQLEEGTVTSKTLFGWLTEDVFRAMGLDSSRVTAFQEYLRRYGELDRKRKLERIDSDEKAELRELGEALRVLPRGDPAVLLQELNNMADLLSTEEEPSS